MAILEVTSILCAVLTILRVAWGIPPEYNLCDYLMLPCQCGTPGFTFHLEIKQCSYFYKWDAVCKPCKTMNETALCTPYRQCLRCSSYLDGCSQCHSTRYGRWCEHECGCQNGGLCDAIGRCSCTAGFHGNKCEKGVECARPSLTEHVIILPNALTYSVGSTINFRCEEGFLLQGDSEAKCTNKGKWSKTAPTCLPLCPALTVPEHGHANLPIGQIVPGTRVYFWCDEGFVLSGPSSRRCQEDGLWSRTQPKCVRFVTCPQPRIPANSIIPNSSPTSPFRPGSTASFSCMKDFVLVGQETVTCEETGKWSQQAPLCVRSDETCVSPSLLNGKFRVEDGMSGGNLHLIGTRLQFYCEPLYLLIGSPNSTCQGNGTWSASMPTCEIIPSCRFVGGLSNGNIRFLKPWQQGSLKGELPEGFYEVGTRAMFDCESQYYEPYGSSMRTCLTSGDWSGRPTMCVPICGRSSSVRQPLKRRATNEERKTRSDIGQWPWFVDVSRDTMDGDYQHVCGASLIDEQWLVTAAHCVTYESHNEPPPVNEFQFYAGKHFLNYSLDDDEVQIRKADLIIVHPDFDPFSFDSDIALVRLSQPFHLSSRVQPVCLPSRDPIKSQERMKAGNRGVLVGWIREDTDPSGVMWHVEAPLISTNTCIQDYTDSGLNIRITSNMFCAGDDTGKQDSCDEDGGNPFVFPADTLPRKYFLEGMASWGSPNGCGIPKQYSGYVRVQNFVDWIRSVQ